MKLRIDFSALVFILLFYTESSFAQEDFFSTIEVVQSQDKTEVEPWVSGFVKQKIKYGIDAPDQNYRFERDSPGVSQIQTDIFAEFRRGIAKNINVNVSVKFELDWLQWQSGEREYELNHEKLFIKDAYVDYLGASGFWLRAGHQIFAWGESEGLAVTDVLSPRDLREPGQAELRDIREHIPALLFSTRLGEFSISSVFSYDAGADRLSDRSEEFYPFIELVDVLSDLRFSDPQKEWEVATRLDMQFNGGDFSLIAADINDNQVVIGLAESSGSLALLQERQKVFGASLSKVWGSWLLKSEAAHVKVRELELFSRRKDQQRAMLGVEYSGWNNILIGVEANLKYFETAQLLDANSTDDARSFFGAVARVRHTSFNERWINQLWVFELTDDESHIVRWDSLWEWSDQIELGASAALYDGNNSTDLLYPFRKNDTVELSFRWNF